MNLLELDPEDFHRIKPMAATAAEIHLSIAAVIERAAEGEIHVDRLDSPTLAVLHGPEGVYLLTSGQLDGTTARAVAEHLDDWAYLHVADAAIPKAALPNAHMLCHPRQVFNLPLDVDPPMALPVGYELVRDAQDFGHRIVFGGEEICHCLPDVILGERAEIGIWTHAGHRRRGLANHALRATLRAARASGISRMGWHCHASNAGSIALARGVGAAEPVFTTAFSVSLPAENRDDLLPAKWQALAQHFVAGRDEIAWLGFHAACALAAAGENEQALNAIERLVDDRWLGQSSWLLQHWALAEIVRHPRMSAAIERLEKQKAPPG